MVLCARVGLLGASALAGATTMDGLVVSAPAAADEVFPPLIDGILALDVGIALNDGLIFKLFERGQKVPATRVVLLASAGPCEVAVVCGARPTVTASRQLVVAVVPPSGGQIATKVRVSARTVRVRCTTFDASGNSTTTTATTAQYPEQQTTLSALPSLFRFDRDAASGGFALSNDVFVRVEVRGAREDVPVGTDGDVDPEFTASRLWPAAYELARLLEAERDLVVGKRVVDLGSGTGFVGIAAAKLGAAVTFLTDLPGALPRLNRALDLNGLSAPTATASALDWTRPADLSSKPPVDLVLAADCVFWPRLYHPLIDTLDALRSQNPSLIVLISVTHRLDRVALFLDALQHRAWQATPCPHPHPRAASIGTAIYRLETVGE